MQGTEGGGLWCKVQSAECKGGQLVQATPPVRDRGSKNTYLLDLIHFGGSI